MTIDEAIIYHIQKADSYHKAMPNYGEAADHRQLAEWLTDYKELKNSIGAVKLELLKEAQAELEKRSNMLHDAIAELEEAKRLLKAAVEDNKRVLTENFGDICLFCKHYSNSEAQCRKPHNGSGSWCCENAEWRYTDEALKLIGGVRNG